MPREWSSLGTILEANSNNIVSYEQCILGSRLFLVPQLHKESLGSELHFPIFYLLQISSKALYSSGGEFRGLNFRPYHFLSISEITRPQLSNFSFFVRSCAPLFSVPFCPLARPFPLFSTCTSQGTHQQAALLPGFELGSTVRYRSEIKVSPQPTHLLPSHSLLLTVHVTFPKHSINKVTICISSC